MTIDEAIEILEAEIHEGYYAEDSPPEKAAKLGIEALKWIEENRGKGAGHVPRLLPGETEEVK